MQSNLLFDRRQLLRAAHTAFNRHTKEDRKD
jgi:hypothetical protein